MISIPLGNLPDNSSEESRSDSLMSHEQRMMTDTPSTDGGLASPLNYYLNGTQTPSPAPDKVAFWCRNFVGNAVDRAGGNIS